jgi:hypothetical protein
MFREVESVTPIGGDVFFLFSYFYQTVSLANTVGWSAYGKIKIEVIASILWLWTIFDRSRIPPMKTPDPILL